jgi:hypothetical protein
VSSEDSTPSGPAADEPRDAYPHALAIPTRWKDNDVYGHVNNVDYYAYFDTVINQYLIAEGGLDIHRGDVIGLCAESHCRYHAAVIARVWGDLHDRAARCHNLTRPSGSTHG